MIGLAAAASEACPDGARRRGGGRRFSMAGACVSVSIALTCAATVAFVQACAPTRRAQGNATGAGGTSSMGSSMGLAAGSASDPRGARTGRATSGLGLELVRWYVAADPKLRSAAIARIEESGAASRIASGLSREQVMLLRAKTARLGEIAALFEGPRAARRTALGQTEVFTDLATVELGRDFVVFSDGRPERSTEGLLRLALRGWCFATVDAAAARIELRLAVTPNRLAGVSLDPAAARERMTDLPEGRATIELAADESLILLEIPFVPPEPEEGADPPALPPPSRAALLLDGRPFPDRALVLVIEPNFADILPGSNGIDPTLRDDGGANPDAVNPDAINPDAPQPEMPEAGEPAPAGTPEGDEPKTPPPAP
jgi:hypothetical protein